MEYWNENYQTQTFAYLNVLHQSFLHFHIHADLHHGEVKMN